MNILEEALKEIKTGKLSGNKHDIERLGRFLIHSIFQ